MLRKWHLLTEWTFVAGRLAIGTASVKVDPTDAAHVVLVLLVHFRRFFPRARNLLLLELPAPQRDPVKRVDRHLHPWLIPDAFQRV